MTATDPYQSELRLGRELRDSALAQVDEHASEDWKRIARAGLWARIRQGGEFTTDDLDVPVPREPRAWGPVILAAQKAGLIRNTGRVRQSRQARCHARPKAVWAVDEEAVRRAQAAQDARLL